jgi:hypothetical protein
MVIDLVRGVNRGRSMGMFAVLDALFAALCGVVPGAVAGYVAGVIVGGVFLVVDPSQDIHNALEQQKVASRLVVFEKAGHGLGHQDREQAMSERVGWFETHLANGDRRE